MGFKEFIQDRGQYIDPGLLIVRIGIGLSMLLFHGYGKLIGGVERWHGIGSQMENFGIHFLHTFWGFMAMFSEFFCSALLILGLFFRPAAGLLVITMFVAVVRHLSLPPDATGAGFKGASHAIEFMTIYLALFLTGPGKYRISMLWSKP